MTVFWQCHSFGLLLHGISFRPFNPSSYISVKQILRHQTGQQVLQLHTAHHITRYLMGCIHHMVHDPIHSVRFHVDKWKSVAFNSGSYDLQLQGMNWYLHWSDNKIGILVRMLCRRNAMDNGHHEKGISHVLKVTLIHMSMLYKYKLNLIYLI